ncbi:hypothetical protein ACOSQ3_009023 [Xanthoceras sorbifolium]
MEEFRPSSFKSHGGGGGGRKQINWKTMQTNEDLSPSHYRPNVTVKECEENIKNPMKTWWNDPETKRKKRVAKYKFYSVEGKVKSSLKKGFRWMKKKYSHIIHGV